MYRSTLAGLEPAIFGPEVRRLIHWLRIFQVEYSLIFINRLIQKKLIWLISQFVKFTYIYITIFVVFFS